MSRQGKKLIFLTLVITVAIAIIVVSQMMIRRGAGKEYVVVIPSGSFIPPEDWAGEMRFDNRYFNPSNLTISRGDTVRWVNMDSVTHTVTDVSGQNLFDEVLNPNESFTFRFNEKGRIIYICTVHPWQAGLIEVR